MATYTCRTVDATGATKDVRIEAASEAEAKARVQRGGVLVIRVRQTGADEADGRSRPAARGPKRASVEEVATNIRQMSILARAGIPLVEGIRSLAEQAKSQSLRLSLEQIAADVSHGSALSESFARHPHVFPRIAVETARVAEAGGNLADSMAKLAENLERGAEIRRKIRSAMAYPIVVVCLSIVTMLVLMTFILPRFMKLFDSMGAKVPWTTKAMMAVSHAMISQWYLFIGGTALSVYLIRRYVRSESGRRKLDALVLRLPVVGDIVTKIVLSRVLSSIATLLSSGVPMTQTLETSASAANNEIVRDALLAARRRVVEGQATSQSLRESGMFPPLVLQMFASGEKAGQLPAMLEHVCALYDQETDAKVKSLTSIIEPVLIVLLGVVVGFIAISVILPIYSLVGSVK